MNSKLTNSKTYELKTYELKTYELKNLRTQKLANSKTCNFISQPPRRLLQAGFRQFDVYLRVDAFGLGG